MRLGTDNMHPAGAGPLPWRSREGDLRPFSGGVSRMLAYLFGLGALLLLFTLLLPGAQERDEAALVAIALVAFVTAVVLYVRADQLPMTLLVLAPGAASLLVGAVICFAGTAASAAYALYFSWVLIAAANYLSRTLTALHGAFAVLVYAAAIAITGESLDDAALPLAMLAGTAIAATTAMAGVAAQVRRVVSQLEDDARTDPLTGLANRRALQEELERALARSDRSARPVALIVCDLDHFKAFNDARGHLAGDDALRALAEILTEVTRSAELAARIGGEEFAIVAPETDVDGARALAERVRTAVEAEFSSDPPALTVSCGIAVRHVRHRTPREIFEAADRALYAAKAGGRNRVEVEVGAPTRLELATAPDSVG